MACFPEGIVLLLSIGPMVIVLVLIVYFITLFNRLVHAVEKISRKLESEQ